MNTYNIIKIVNFINDETKDVIKDITKKKRDRLISKKEKIQREKYKVDYDIEDCLSGRDIKFFEESHNKFLPALKNVLKSLYGKSNYPFLIRTDCPYGLVHKSINQLKEDDSKISLVYRVYEDDEGLKYIDENDAYTMGARKQPLLVVEYTLSNKYKKIFIDRLIELKEEHKRLSNEISNINKKIADIPKKATEVQTKIIIDMIENNREKKSLIEEFTKEFNKGD